MSSISLAITSFLSCGRYARPTLTNSESTTSRRCRPISQEELLPTRSSRNLPSLRTTARAHPYRTAATASALPEYSAIKPTNRVRFNSPLPLSSATAVSGVPPNSGDHARASSSIRRGISERDDPGDDEDQSDSELTSEEDMETSDSEVSKIPKPEGEAGRPGRGGYNLESVLQWNGTEFLRLKRAVHRLVEAHLDETKPFSQQSLALINVVKQKALSKFSLLNEYQGLWPVEDLLRLRLKYTCARSKRRLEKMSAGKKKGA